MSIGPPIPDTAFSKFDLENLGSRLMTMMLHNYMARQFHRTSNGINPSSLFRDMGSAKSGQSAVWFDKSLAHGQASPYVANGQITMTLHNYRSRQVHETKWGKSIQRFQRYAFRKLWTQFVANLTSYWPMGKSIWGKWANDHDSVQQQGQTIPQNFERRKSIKQLQRYGFRKSGSRPPGLPDRDDNTPPARRAER